MKQKYTRLLGLLLALVLLLGCFPLQAMAAESGWFYLVADWNGELLIAPQRISYTADQTIFEALNASGHSFAPSAQSVTQIDGKAGNFIRSDESGSYDLTRNAAASGIRYLCFADNSSGSRTAQPSAAMQGLISAMADYLLEEADVQAAAKTQYDEAFSGYCAADDAQALRLCAALTDAITQYRQALNGTKYTVSFSDKNSVWTAGDSLYAENQYGRVYQDTDHDGALSLPAGDYSFTMQAQSGGVTGSFSVSGQSAISVSLDRADWLQTDGFMLSSRTKTDFEDNQFPVEATAARELEAIVIDSFSGTLYAFWPYDAGAVSELPKLTALYTPAGSTEQRSTAQSLRSKISGIDGALAAGSQGNTVIYRASIQTTQGYTQYQDYTLRLRRSPTLKDLRVSETNGSPAALEEYDPSTRTYTYLVLGQEVSLTLTPSVETGCEIYVDGKNITETRECTITVTDEEQTVRIELKAGGETTAYDLVLRRSGSCVVRIPVESADIALTVCDQNGQAVSGTFSESAKQYRFTLIPGKTYTYTATKQTYYHATDSFTASDKTLPRVSVQTGSWLTELALAKDGTKSSKGNIALDQAFDPEVHTYTATVPDTPPAVYLWIDGDIQTASTKFYAQYRTITSSSQDNQSKEIAISASQLGSPVFLQNLLLNQNGRGNLLTVRCQRKSGTVTYYQDYQITIHRTFSLESLSVFCGGQEQVLTHSGGASGYTPSVWDYIVTVPAASTELSVCASVYTSDACYRDNGNTGYHVWLGDQELTSGNAASAQLNGTTEPETVTLTLTNEFAEGDSSTYHIQVQKAEPIHFTPVLTPADALLFIRDTLSGQRIWPDDSGAYALSNGFSYDYLLTCPGYVGHTGTIEAAHSGNGSLIVRIDGTEYPVSGGAASAAMTLSAAQKNETLQQLAAQWADFRGTSYDATGKAGGSKGSNNTVLSVQTPVDADRSTLYWANKLGDGFDSGATGCPILVDDVLITYAGRTIYRIDPVSGEILAQATMERASSFAITPPAYAKGMVFVGLSDGTIQAFDAKTLQSLWVYHDALKGQPNCPITICGDYLYTGFWRGEEFTANFVCLSITDEDPSRENEEKTACWYWTNKGGYYWAGAYACEDYVLVGADDGVDGYRSMTGSLLLFDAKTGRLLDQWTGLLGDVRSTICYDSATDAFYFTTKGGWFCGVKTEKTADGWRLQESSKWTLRLENVSSTEPAMSTSTPTVYNGRAYIGVSGSAQFGAYSGHSITVLDLTAHKIAYHTQTMGYPQTSGILTTAYEAGSGYVYVYFIDNFTPGKLRVLRDKPGQTKADYLTVESGKDTPYVLFTPSGEEAQYAICTPVVDSYGVMYFKNDTAKMMAFGPSATLEIVTQPDKTRYAAGEVFDPSGMQVDLVYANGLRRDVTKYVKWSDAPLTEADTDFAIRFPYVMYHDQDSEESGHETNVATPTPVASVKLTVGAGEAAGGTIGSVTWVYREETETLQIGGTFGSGQTLAAACYEQSGRLLQVKLLTAAGTISLPKDASKVRLFLMDKNQKPVCAAVTVKG